MGQETIVGVDLGFAFNYDEPYAMGSEENQGKGSRRTSGLYTK